jgi:hypothetical protein
MFTFTKKVLVGATLATVLCAGQASATHIFFEGSSLEASSTNGEFVELFYNQGGNFNNPTLNFRITLEMDIVRHGGPDSYLVMDFLRNDAKSHANAFIFKRFFNITTWEFDDEERGFIEPIGGNKVHVYFMQNADFLDGLHWRGDIDVFIGVESLGRVGDFSFERDGDPDFYHPVTGQLLDGFTYRDFGFNSAIPGPAAALPFLIGGLSALRRRKARR